MRITKSQLKYIIQEETKNERCYQIIEAEYRRIDIMHQKFNKQQVEDMMLFESKYGSLNELWSPMDLANALLYIKEKAWFMAGLSLISMLPVLGDIIGKGGKLATMGAKGGKAGAWLAKTLSKFMPAITKGLNGLKKHPKVGAFIKEILQSIMEFVAEAQADPNNPKVLTATAQATKVRKVQPANPQSVKRLKAAAAQVPQQSGA